jgi:hypothetical protein
MACHFGEVANRVRRDTRACSFGSSGSWAAGTGMKPGGAMVSSRVPRLCCGASICTHSGPLCCDVLRRRASKTSVGNGHRLQWGSASEYVTPNSPVCHALTACIGESRRRGFGVADGSRAPVVGASQLVRPWPLACLSRQNAGQKRRVLLEKETAPWVEGGGTPRAPLEQSGSRPDGGGGRHRPAASSPYVARSIPARGPSRFSGLYGSISGPPCIHEIWVSFLK